MAQIRTEINLKNKTYNKKSYDIGRRITSAHIAKRVGYFDQRTNLMFKNEILSYSDWLELVISVKTKTAKSFAQAANYVNQLYSVKLKIHKVYSDHVSRLKDNCGKLFSVAP